VVQRQFWLVWCRLKRRYFNVVFIEVVPHP
jgi:hypothetical protein